MTPTQKGLYRFALALACATAVLIFIGGLVTSTGSGLSVPDWPLSYGRLMPPMVGGVFFEHGHRMAAATVGLVSVLVAVVFSWKEERRWVKGAAWAAVGLVVLQGLLGGLTVLFRLPKPISIAHACLAQTFFCLTVALAVWSSGTWRRHPKTRRDPEGALPLHQGTLALLVTAYLQLILGAILRHTGRVLPFHITGAVMVAALAFWVTRRIWTFHRSDARLTTWSGFLVALLLTQIALGVATYFILVHRFDTIPTPFPAIVVVTLHVATGALVLGASIVLALLSYRDRSPHPVTIQTKVSDYLELTKPGISFMAGATALAGFVLGSKGHIDLLRLLHTCLGTLMVAAGAGTLNMLIETDVDSRMRRTQRRPLPSGRMKPGEALFIGTLLSAAGILYLFHGVNMLTGGLAAVTLAVYLYLYTPLKKVSGICVSVGAVAGALPPVMGWAAATGRLGVESAVLFGILFFWQFPHFLSLAWLYKDDYARAGLHMLPTPEPNGTVAARTMLANSVALLAVSCLPTVLGLTGRLYLGTALALGGLLTAWSIRFMIDHSPSSARKIFFGTLVYMPLLVILMVVNKAAGS